MTGNIEVFSFKVLHMASPESQRGYGPGPCLGPIKRVTVEVQPLSVSYILQVKCEVIK